MPNPRAQRQLTLDRVVSDLKSFAEPAQAMGDMMAGALRGSVAATSGVGGDIRELIDLFGADAVEKVLGKRVMPTTEEMKKILPSAVPQDASASRKHTAEMFGSLGEFAPTPMTGTAAKALSYGLGRGAGALTRGAGKMVNDAMVYNQGPLAQGSLSFLAPQTATMHIIKPEGGNWLTGNVEKSVEPLRRHDLPDLFPEFGEPPPNSDTNKAINKWIDSNLANYVKKQMGTESDPIRKLAEQDITHLPRELAEPNVEAWTPDELAEARVQAGFPAEGVGKSNLAQMWEQMADQSIYPYKAKDFQTVNKLVSKQNQAIYDMQKLEEEAKVLARKNLIEKLPDQSPEGIDIILRNIDNPTMYELAGSGVAKKINKLREKIFQYEVPQVGFKQRAFEENPWLTKVDPETNIYHTQTGGLGFDHIVDVLKQDVAEGRIRPEQLNKVSMEQAVRRTHEYDQEMARKMAEAQIKATEGMPVHKEYPEGYKWIELKAPEELPEGWTKKTGALGETLHYDPQGRMSINPNQEKLEQALNYEGETMGHCVGGYCPDVIEGRSRIYSLRDPRGEPHVTVEVRPNQARSKYETDWLMSQPEDVQDKITKQALAEHEATKATRTPEEDRFTWGQALSNAIKSHMGEVPDQIIQIKGKQNRAPKEEYLPYVQDFVRGGNWSDVGDLRNTGLMDVENFLNPTTREKYLEHKLDIPKYATEAELDKLHNEYLRLAEPNNYIPPETGMKKGGKVSISDNCDCQHMEVMDKHMAGGGALSKAAIEALERMKALKPEFQARTNLLNKYKAETASIPYNEVKPFQMTNEQIREEMDRMAREQAEREQSKAKGGAVEKLIKLARAPAKSKAEIEAIAQRIAPQMTGEYVRASDKTAKTVAGKTQKQFEREKTLEHDIRPTEGVERPPVNPVDIESLKGNVMMGIAGDPTITGQTIYSVAGRPLRSPAPQHGGPLYGLGKEDEFWASNLGAAQGVQNRAKGLSELYESPVVGNYVMMGPDSYSYAQHFADTNLQNIRPELMTKKQIEGFNKLVRQGSLKSGPRPSFPGIENPEEAYLHFAVDPELRKHFGNLMQMPTVTEKFGLPSGQDVAHAVTEPDLRNLEIGVTGKSLGLMKPDVTDLKLSSHPTYSHDIPGQFLGGMKYPVPHDLMFPDTLKSVRENPAQAPQEFGSFKMVGPRQVIDQQMIDEIKQYQDMIKKYTGKKKGGKVKKMAEGGEITGEDLIIEERPL